MTAKWKYVNVRPTDIELQGVPHPAADTGSQRDLGYKMGAIRSTRARDPRATNHRLIELRDCNLPL